MPNSKRIFISNRLPFSIDPETSEVKRGSGGLVTALLGVDLKSPFLWMGFETDSEVARRMEAGRLSWKANLAVQPVLIDKKLYEDYYDKFSNETIWPLFHYEGHHGRFSRKYWLSYIKANELMAKAILKQAGPNDSIWIHDFHFLLLPGLLRKKSPHLRIGFFLHIPFPSSEIFRQLPVREKILLGLTACDLIGFHDHSYLRHFTVCLSAFLGVESTFFKAEVGDHVLRLGVYPISIDTRNFKTRSKKSEVEKKCQRFRKTIPSPFLILGVDRLDYTKGIELKLRGFRRALKKFPDLRGKINLFQIAVPTRTRVPAYIALKTEVDRLVGTINGEFAEPGYTPVQYIFNSIAEPVLLALYKRANCLLVTSKRDGMNLVSMEYVIAQSLDNPGTLILSEFTGAASLLGSGQIINPWDEEAIADAIHKCYLMPQEEKKAALNQMQKTLLQYSATEWAQTFLSYLSQTRVKHLSAPTRPIQVSSNTWPEDFKMKIQKSQRVLVFMDFDGTLVPLQNDPTRSHMTPATVKILREMHSLFDIYVVSGRPRSFLDEEFSKLKTHLAAEHGAFSRNSQDSNMAWKNLVSSDIRSWFGEVRRVMTDYSEKVPSSFVEEKEAAIVWHYRESPPGFADYQAKKLLDELQVGLANQPVSITSGSKIIEAKALECNKGNFTRSVLESLHKEKTSTFSVCIGDDRTDEDMFRLFLDQDGASIKVGQGNTLAKYRIQSQAEVLGLFTEMLMLRKQKLTMSPGASL